MIIRDFSSISYQEGNLSVQNRLRGMMQHGFSWPAEMESQEVVIRHLKRSLDRTYTLLRNISLPDLEITIPLVLVGHHGITVLYNTPTSGVFRADGEKWTIMDRRSGSYKSAKPNLIRRTALMTRAVEIFLKENDYTDIPVEGILVCTNMKTHVDTRRPNVSVVLIDALERFAARIISAPPKVRREKRYKIIRAITSHMEKEAEDDDNVPGDKSQSKGVAQSIDSGFDQAMQPLQKRFDFSTRQWIVLGGIVLAEVLILVAFLVVIMLTS
ncbi:MAG: hypothetical protein U9Q82_10300 [Chloroflexota bacterium]|nr:hypothetical protein [Chloroflexota bacterium]